MVRVRYAWEKLFSAVLTMACSSDSVQLRLADAYVDSLLRLNVEDFPDDLEGDFRDILAEFAKIRLDGDRGIRAVIESQMSEGDANKLAERIVSLYNEITRRNAIEDL
jgi:hypothetical protein